MIILIIILAVYAALRPVKQPLKTPAQIEREYRAIIRAGTSSAYHCKA